MNNEQTMKNLMRALLDAIYEAGTIMSLEELKELAFGPYGATEWVEDAEGNVVDSVRIFTREGLQEIANIYTNGFDCLSF